MTENKSMIPEPVQNTSLTDEQLSEVAGGEAEIVLVHPMAFKYCTADYRHVYPDILEACPVCGCKTFTAN